MGEDRVPFRETLDALPPDDQQRLLNRLTLGCGRMAYAARLALADAQCGDILGSLTAAQTALAGAAALLTGESAVGTGDPQAAAVGGSQAGRPALGWRDFLATRGPGDAAALVATFEEVAHQTRELGRAVLADADTDHVHRHLTATISALGDLRQRLTAI